MGVRVGVRVGYGVGDCVGARVGGAGVGALVTNAVMGGPAAMMMVSAAMLRLPMSAKLPAVWTTWRLFLNLTVMIAVGTAATAVFMAAAEEALATVIEVSNEKEPARRRPLARRRRRALAMLEMEMSFTEVPESSLAIVRR